MQAILISILLVVLVTSPPPPGSTFTLTFEYAARSGVYLETSLAEVIWNNDIILSIVPTDYDIHTATVDVTAIVGANILQFEGAGASDSVGLDFTNVALIQQGDVTNTNIVVNGDFSQPNQGGGVSDYNSIPGWTGNGLEIGAGPLYGDVWSNVTQLCELDATVNYQISQTWILDSNFQVIANATTPPACLTSALFTPSNYTLQFDWAPNTVGTDNILTSQGNILWNTIIIDSLVPTNHTLGVNHVSYSVISNSCGQNSLQFDGTEEGDGFGISITNVILTTDTGSQINLSNGDWVAANPEFADCSTFNSQWSAGQSQCLTLDSGTNQRYTQAIIVAITHRKAFDIVGPLTKTAFGCLAQQGYTYVSVRASSNILGGVDPNAIQTLQNAQAAGLQTAIYVVLCPSQDVISPIMALLQAIPSNLYSTIWFKVLSNSPGCSWQGTNTSMNCQMLGISLQISLSTGVSIGVFSTKAIWNSVFGTTCPFGIYQFIHLWYADYQSNGIVDPTESFSDFIAYGGFGGWTQPDLKTTVGTTHVTLCNNPAWHALINIDWHL